MRKKMKWFLVIIVVAALGAIYLEHNMKNRNKVNEKIAVQAFDKLDIDSSTDVKLVTSDHYRVSYSGQEKLKPSVKVKNGTLSIASPKKSVTINGNIFNIGELKQSLTIEMPKKELKYISIDTSNGDVSADDLKVQKGTIDTSNGDIKFKNLITKNGFEIDTSNGTVKVEKSNADGYDLSTSNGDIVLAGKKKSDEFWKNTDAKNVLNVDTSNGNIYVN